MVSETMLNEKELDLLVSYDIEDGALHSEAVVDAFLAADVAVYEKSSSLEDWIDTDVIDTSIWTSTRGPFYISAQIWGHRVVLTADRVRIYVTSPDTTEGPDRIEDSLH